MELRLEKDMCHWVGLDLDDDGDTKALLKYFKT